MLIFVWGVNGRIYSRTSSNDQFLFSLYSDASYESFSVFLIDEYLVYWCKYIEWNMITWSIAEGVIGDCRLRCEQSFLLLIKLINNISEPYISEPGDNYFHEIINTKILIYDSPPVCHIITVTYTLSVYHWAVWNYIYAIVWQLEKNSNNNNNENDNNKWNWCIRSKDPSKCVIGC